MQNKAGAVAHLKNHQKYPANKAALLAECDNLSDFSAEDKKWFSDHLPEGMYNNADEVMKVLSL